MEYFGCPYNDLVICKDGIDCLGIEYQHNHIALLIQSIGSLQ